MLILSAKIVLFFELCKFFGVGLSEIVGIYRILSEIIGRAAQIQAKEETACRILSGVMDIERKVPAIEDTGTRWRGRAIRLP